MTSPIDVDAILAEVAKDGHRERVAPPTLAKLASRDSYLLTPTQAGAAAILGANWPAKGGRHAAQLALAGALKHDGWPAETALEFLRATCAAAGDEDPAKRRATIEHTWATEAVTGWSSLAVHPDIKRLVRDKLSALPRQVPALRSDEPAKPAEASDWGRIDWDFEDPPIKWAIGGILQAGTVNLAFGPPNSLKTWTCYSMATAVAKGEPWFGRAVERGLAVILDYESSQRQARRRMRVLKRQGLGDVVRYVNPSEMLDDVSLWGRVASLRPALVLVDSLSRGMIGRDENDPAAAAAPLSLAKQLGRDVDACVLFVHHKRKNAAEGANGARGSSAIVAAAEGWLEFDGFVREEQVQRATLHCARLKESVPFDDLSLELTDEAGLTVKAAEVASASGSETLEGAIVRLLKSKPTGITKTGIVDMLKMAWGADEVRAELARMDLVGTVREYRDRGRPLIELSPK